MHFESFLALIAIALAFTFDFVNGFHDTANAVATVIYTKALRAPTAIFMSGFLNFLGCLCIGTAVAQLVTAVIPRDHISLTVIFSVLAGSLIWNIYTWYHGIPVSSTHCLIGALFGAGLACGGWSGVAWSKLSEALLALVLSPVLGFAAGLVLTWLVTGILCRFYPEARLPGQQPQVIRWLQVLSSAAVSFTHGSNDGQKTMGIITLILATCFAHGGYTYNQVPLWVMVAAALSIGLGTMIGGWRIIRTIGTKISRERIQYTQGFAAEFGTASIILAGSLFGAPVSTTHTLTSAVAGTSVPLHGVKSLNMKTLKLIFTAWVFTLPTAAALAALCYVLFRFAGLS